MASVAGFEPAGDGVRIRCLTAWRYPNNVYSIYFLNKIVNAMRNLFVWLKVLNIHTTIEFLFSYSFYTVLIEYLSTLVTK